jgi:hypothetical protein
VDSEKNAESWDQAAEFFKAAVSKEDRQKAFPTFRTTLGKMTSRKLDSKQYTTTARAHRTAGGLLSGAGRASRTKNPPSRRPAHPG